MQTIQYGFIDPINGLFLRVFTHDHDPDNAGIGSDFEFTLDKDYPVYECDQPAALLDIMFGPQNGRYLSQDGLYGSLPTPFRIDIQPFVPVAFIKEFRPVIEGGDAILTSTEVRLVRFDDTSDPGSLWLDDLEHRFLSAEQVRNSIAP